MLVVDDGSTDGTAEAARAAGAEAIVHPMNQGKGAALRTGFGEALSRGVPGVVTMDADGQHPTECLPDFLDAARTADLVVGCRMEDPAGMPWLRLQTNRLTSWVVSALARRRIRDSQCGYRWISSEVLRAMKLATSNYETESEILIRAGRSGFRIAELTIPAVYREETSHIRRGLDTLRFLRLVARFV